MVQKMQRATGRTSLLPRDERLAYFPVFRASAQVWPSPDVVTSCSGHRVSVSRLHP